MVGAVTQRAFPPVQLLVPGVSRAGPLPEDYAHPVKSLLCRHSKARPHLQGLHSIRQDPIQTLLDLSHL